MAEIVVDKPIVYSDNTSDTYPSSSTFEKSSVALIKNKKVKYYGKNIQHQPKSVAVGDVLFIDSNDNKYWYDGESLTNNPPKVGLTAVGVVINRKGNKALVHYKNRLNQNYQWVTGICGNNNNDSAKFFDNVTNFNNNANLIADFPSNYYFRRINGNSTNNAPRTCWHCL